MKCPKCGNNYCEIISNKKVHGSDFSVCGAFFGELLFGADGFCCGFCSSSDVDVQAYWKCKKCGYTFKK